MNSYNFIKWKINNIYKEEKATKRKKEITSKFMEEFTIEKNNTNNKNSSIGVNNHI